MRKSIPAPAMIAAGLLAFVAGQHVAYAAPNDCLTAPNGATPKGQHWYYHLDRANNRKCWYLRDVGASAATPTAAPQADNSAPATPVATPTAAASAANAATAVPPVRQPAVSPAAVNSSQLPQPTGFMTDARGGSDGGAPADVAPAIRAATPAPAPSAASGAATVWSDPQPPAAPVQSGAAATAQPVPAAAPDASARRAPAKKHAVLRESTAATVASAPKASATSIGQNVLVMLLAALLAGAVFAVFAVLRRRRPVKVRAARGGPRFGSGGERDDGLWLKWPRRGSDAAPPAAPIQSSFIPQQVNMTRQSAPRR